MIEHIEETTWTEYQRLPRSLDTIYHISTHKGEWWLLGDNYHRTDGPAIIRTNEEPEWWINGMLYRNNKIFQIKAGLTDEEMTAMILRYGDVR